MSDEPVEIPHCPSCGCNLDPPRGKGPHVTKCESVVQHGVWDVENIRWVGVKDLTDAPLYVRHPSTENAVLVYGDIQAAEIAASDLEGLRGRAFEARAFGCDALD